MTSMTKEWLVRPGNEYSIYPGKVKNTKDCDWCVWIVFKLWSCGQTVRDQGVSQKMGLKFVQFKIKDIIEF